MKRIILFPIFIIALLFTSCSAVKTVSEMGADGPNFVGTWTDSTNSSTANVTFTFKNTGYVKIVTSSVSTEDGIFVVTTSTKHITISYSMVGVEVVKYDGTYDFATNGLSFTINGTVKTPSETKSGIYKWYKQN